MTLNIQISLLIFSYIYGFCSLIHANSLLEGGRAIARASLVGGHAGGMGGLD